MSAEDGKRIHFATDLDRTLFQRSPNIGSTPLGPFSRVLGVCDEPIVGAREALHRLRDTGRYIHCAHITARTVEMHGVTQAQLTEHGLDRYPDDQYVPLVSTDLDSWGKVRYLLDTGIQKDSGGNYLSDTDGFYIPSHPDQAFVLIDDSFDVSEGGLDTLLRNPEYGRVATDIAFVHFGASSRSVPYIEGFIYMNLRGRFEVAAQKSSVHFTLTSELGDATAQTNLHFLTLPEWSMAESMFQLLEKVMDEMKK